jgi:Ca-activated chloride channel homolog
MLYDERKYKEAATEYNKALQKNPNNAPALFNLGNSLYQQKQFDATRKVMDATAKAAKDKDSKGEANYTIGNTYMEEKKWEDAVASYKTALRNNPHDPDAKYNLSYAEEMLKKNNKGGGGGKDNKDQKNKQDQKNKDKQNKDQQNKDKDKQDQDKDQQNKDQQNKDKQDQNKDQDQQHPQGQPSKLSQQQADQLLNALQQEEKKLQDKQQKEKGFPEKLDKDW